ncbi:putative enzyme related to lactoylglutathione lyase [Thermocatellispora tengchongensis]|uniref:Putative enzyme related to lactoylglutathione lyase n=1 Tax=Thermocatellispora tengchongensis TaxID=1073253 RepID=A0A840PCZ0_9ACTN|nr:VOC family protein [Thermocatellispora tengchongensis]MBB5135290.1 putative enzyme related to lactoylglutathione lyase [Thermocatellispora tengchongensis]
MRDPFEALREQVRPVAPDPAFAARLRARLERAVLDPAHHWRRDDMTTGTMLRHGDLGYASLWLPDAAKAAEFYGDVLGWRIAPGSTEQGRRIEGVTPSLGIWGGQERRTLFLCYAVDDIAAAIERIRAAGGTAGEATREPYGLISMCQDDQGLPFAVYEDAGEGRPAAGPPHPGELAYLTIEVPDDEAAKAFYGAVFGWEFTPGSVEHGWNVLDAGRELRPMTGLWGGRAEARAVPMYAVADIEAGVAAVRAKGGTAGDPVARPFGQMAECHDDQGCFFYLGRLTP